MLLWCVLALYFSVRLNADHDEKRIGCVPALLSCLRDTLFQGAGHGEFYSVASCKFYKHQRNRTLAFCALRFPLPASFPYRKKRSHRLWSDSLKSKFVGGRCQKQPCDRISSVGLNHESFAKCPQRPMRTSIQDLAMYLELQSLVVRMWSAVLYNQRGFISYLFAKHRTVEWVGMMGWPTQWTPFQICLCSILIMRERTRKLGGHIFWKHT